jgi:hypothetical protein
MPTAGCASETTVRSRRTGPRAPAPAAGPAITDSQRHGQAQGQAPGDQAVGVEAARASHGLTMPQVQKAASMHEVDGEQAALAAAAAS